MICTLSRDQLANVVDEVFGVMAGMQLAPSVSMYQPNKKDGYIVSAVQIVGAWKGAVRLDIDLAFARHACAHLLGVDPAELSEDDIRDAAGELANMTGGSVKTLLAPTSSLSLPSVAMGQNYEFSFPQGKILQQSSFRHESGGLQVSVVEKPGRDDIPITTGTCTGQ